MGSEYWGGLIKWVKARLLEDKMISEEDIDILQIMDDPEEIVAFLKKMLIL
jgi:predicted Rossmann-fold nucleotide-binding protein